MKTLFLNKPKGFRGISNFQKQILIYAMLIGGILAGKAQTNAQLPTGVKNTVETSIMNKTGQNIDAIVADEMASIDKIWGQSTQLRALSQSYTIETPSPEFDTFFAGIDWTNMDDVSARYRKWVRNVANPNGDPGCSTCPQDVAYGLHGGADTGANNAATWIGNNTTASASTVDSKALNPDDVIDGARMGETIAHELIHGYGVGQVSGQPNHPYGKEIPVAQVEIWDGSQWISYPFAGDISIQTIMHSDGGRPVATNTANFSTSTDGFMYFQMKRNNATPMWSARVPVSELVNNGLETLPKIADELIAPTGMFHNRLREVVIPTNEKIENQGAPEFTIAADGTLSLPTAYSTILTNANINPDNCQFFIYDQSDATDHQNIPRNNVAENVGWNLDETLNIINDYGYTTATASNLRVRVLAVKQNQLSQVGSATNEAPTSGNNSVSTLEDNAYSFNLADFPYTDAEGVPLNHVNIETLPTNGVLKLSGTAVSASDNITANDISNLSFEPNANWFGATSFSFKVSDGENYSDTQTFTINVTSVNDLPVPNVASLPDVNQQCEITATDMPVPSATDVEDGTIWATTSTAFPINTQGNNTVTWNYTDSDGGVSTQTQNGIINDTTNPEAIGSNFQVDLAGNSSVTILPSDVDNGSFDNCGNVTLSLNQDTFTDVGVFDVDLIATDEQGLQDSVTVQITIIDSTASVDNPEIAGFSMYPNPVKDKLTIKTTNEAIDEIIIFNALGQKVFSEKYDGDYLLIELDVRDLPAEKMYFIKTTSGGKTQVEKFIKE